MLCGRGLVRGTGPTANKAGRHSDISFRVGAWPTRSVRSPVFAFLGGAGAIKGWLPKVALCSCSLTVCPLSLVPARPERRPYAFSEHEALETGRRHGRPTVRLRYATDRHSHVMYGLCSFVQSDSPATPYRPYIRSTYHSGQTVCPRCSSFVPALFVVFDVSRPKSGSGAKRFGRPTPNCRQKKVRFQSRNRPGLTCFWRPESDSDCRSPSYRSGCI
jgi:hypothetical protein